MQTHNSVKHSLEVANKSAILGELNSVDMARLDAGIIKAGRHNSDPFFSSQAGSESCAEAVKFFGYFVINVESTEKTKALPPCEDYSDLLVG